MERNNTFKKWYQTIRSKRRDAHAVVQGSREYPNINGEVTFRQLPDGVLVMAEVSGLPTSSTQNDAGVFAFHIHESSSCTGNAQDPFADAGMHYNPTGRPHPEHAGDLPPLFSDNGYAYAAFVTNRFQVKDIVGRTVIIHGMPDDFTTQPSGNAGKKIACGKIVR